MKLDSREQRELGIGLLNHLYTRFKDGVVFLKNRSFNVSNRNGATTAHVKLDEDKVILTVPHDLKKRVGERCIVR